MICFCQIKHVRASIPGILNRAKHRTLAYRSRSAGGFDIVIVIPVIKLFHRFVFGFRSRLLFSLEINNLFNSPLMLFKIFLTG